MKIPKQIHSIWKSEKQTSGLMKIATVANVDFRTVKRAIETGEIQTDKYDAINNAIIQIRQNRIKTEQILLTLKTNEND